MSSFSPRALAYWARDTRFAESYQPGHLEDLEMAMAVMAHDLDVQLAGTSGIKKLFPVGRPLEAPIPPSLWDDVFKEVAA